MKAAQINGYGGEDSLKINRDAPKPIPTADEVLVEVHAAAANPFDWKVREGYMQEFIPLDFPATLGGDVSGIVVQLGEETHGIEIGQAVYGMGNAAGGNGSFAEFCAVKASQLAKKPESLDFTQAAAVPLAAISAYQALIDYMDLKAGQKILIHGGAGGIGSIAVQLAKHIGAYVATTASVDDEAYVKGLGADQAIDYRNQDFSQVLHDYDAVFDTIGGDTNTKSYTVLKPGGKLVSMVEQPDESLADQYQVEPVHQSTQPTIERLTKLAELIDKGILKIHVDKIFSLDQAAEALEYLKTGHPHGKVVIEVKD